MPVQLSVVIPTFRRPALLRQCLRALQQQQLPLAEFEVVVVDDGSGDSTRTVLERAGQTMPNLIAVTQPRNRGPAAARNRGLGEATGELVLFIDDDIVAAPDLVATHLAWHLERRDRNLGLLGRVDWHPGLRVTAFMQWLDRSGLQFAYDTWLEPGELSAAYAAFYTANLSISRQLVLAVGGFDERFPYPAYEDMELAFRLTREGFRLHYLPDARAYHARAIRRREFARRMQRVGESAELMRRLAPQFPLDDQQLRRWLDRRRRRERLRLRAILGDSTKRDEFYWSDVALAYDYGRRRANPSAAD